MKRDQALELIVKYKQILSVKKVLPIEFPTTGRSPSLEQVLSHIAWMLLQMKTLVEDTSTEGKEKLNRWMGFVQNALWQAGIVTIDQLKEDSRPKK